MGVIRTSVRSPRASTGLSGPGVAAVGQLVAFGPLVESPPRPTHTIHRRLGVIAACF